MEKLGGFFDKFKVHIILAILASVFTVAGVRVIPGAVTTAAYAVQRLDARDSAQEVVAAQYRVHMTAHVDTIDRKLDQTTELLRAVARKECATLGHQKAESYGFPCRETTFHLPN
jgi:hypothetical protein